MLKRYNQFYKWWAHPKIQGNPLSDHICWQALIANMMTIFFYIFLIYLFDRYDYKYGIYSCSIGVCTSTSIIFYIRFFTNIPFLNYYSMGMLFIILFVTSYGYGGVWSIFSLGYIVILWWGFNYSSTIGFTLSIALAVWLFFWTLMEYNGFEFPKTFPTEYNYSFRVIFISSALVIFAFLFWMSSQNEQRIREKLAESQEQLIRQEKMASLGQLTAGIAHEINNPLNFINGSTEALAIDFKDIQKILTQLVDLKKGNISSENIQALLDLSVQLELPFLLKEMELLLSNIKEGGERVTEIIQGLKTFTYQSDGKIQSQNLIALLESSLIILSNKLKQKNIEVIKDFQTIPDIPVKGGKINQVFVNVIDNAIEAMEDGGLLTIKMEVQDDQILIELKDNGTGMDESTLKRIFDPFFTTKDVGKGTGLGMAISYGIIKDHDGNIEIESELNKGTSVAIRLPIL